MVSTRMWRSVGTIGAAVLLLGSDCSDGTGPRPPGRSMEPSGTVERGPFHFVGMFSGTDHYGRQLDSASVSIAPMDGVVYDRATKRFQFRLLGTYVLTAVGESPALSTTITVVDAPKILFDMSVNGNRDIYSASIYGFDLARLTADPAADVWPTTSNGVLVFTSYRNGNAELYSKPLNGTETETRLTSTAAHETEAQLSPNGERLAFVRDDGGIPRIWISTANGSSAYPLTNAIPGVRETHPRWYASSDYLLMTSTGSAGTSIYRSPVSPGSTATPFATPASADSIYDDPDVRGLTSANFAVGGLQWIASAPGGPRRALTASVLYNGSGAQRADRFATPASASVGEPISLTSSATRAYTMVYTRFMPDGSTTLGWFEMTAPPPQGEQVWRPISLAGVNPRHAAGIRPLPSP